MGVLLHAAYRGESDDEVLKRGGLHGARTKRDLEPALRKARSLRHTDKRPPPTLQP